MANGKLFREYIGNTHRGIRFPMVPINPDVTVHFILAFAIDVHDVNRRVSTNGVFIPFWDTAGFTQQDVTNIKTLNRNVRVMLSVGGDCIPVRSGEEETVEVRFTPTAADPDRWVENAYASLRDIIDAHGLEGVDINYEHFADGTTAELFSFCIGTLLKRLKQNYPPGKMITSIAPFGDIKVQQYYQQLWRDHHRVIDYVNFQFFGCGAIPNVNTYLTRYDEQVANYPGATVLASFITGDPAIVQMQVTPQVALQAARQLHAEGRLPGLFIWSADNSNGANNGFLHEVDAQSILCSQAP